MEAMVAEALAERNPQEPAISLNTLNDLLAEGSDALGIYLFMLSKTNDQGVCQITNPQLETAIGTSPNTLRKYLKKLIDKGYLRVLDRGNGRGNPSLWTVKDCRIALETTAIKGSMTANKGFNDSDQKGSMTPEKGFNDSVRTPPYISINITRDINTPLVNSREPEVPGTVAVETARLVQDFRSLQYLMAAPEIQRVMQKYHMTPQLTARSLRTLQSDWISSGAPGTPRQAIQRAARWLEAGEITQKHAAWRRESPLEMAGVNPQ
jgi:hypothetical protein